MSLLTYALFASLGFYVHLDAAVVDEQEVDIPLAISEAELQQGTVETRRDGFAFVFNTSATQAFERGFESGIVEKVRLGRRGRQSELMVTVRHGIEIDTLEARLERQPYPSIRLRRLPVAQNTQPQAGVVDAAGQPMGQAAPVASTVGAGVLPNAAPAAAAKAKTEASGGWMQRYMLHFSVLIAGLACLALAALAWRRRRERGPSGEELGIDVLAARSLGGKHRLAVIRTCGQRLLVSVSDKGVGLISDLPGEGDDGVGPSTTTHSVVQEDVSSFVDTYQSALEPEPERDAAWAPRQNSYGRKAATDNPAGEPRGDRDGDNLLRLRERMRYSG